MCRVWPNYHQNVRKAGINYLCTHPEQFIEIVTGKSWSEYINDMSRQGSLYTYDALMVQAVSDALNCVIDITESAVNFNETTKKTCIQRVKKPVHDYDSFIRNKCFS